MFIFVAARGIPVEDSRTRLRDSSTVEKCDESDALEPRVHALGIISPPFSGKRNEGGNFSMNFSPGILETNFLSLSFFFLQLENFKKEENEELEKFVGRLKCVNIKK